MDATVGDVTSTAPGSGARFNAGKVPYELLPLEAVAATVFLGSISGSASRALDIILHLARYQAQKDKPRHLQLALEASCGTNTPSLSDFADAARVFDYGRKKYAEWNWAKGMPWSVPLGCALRHCEEILLGAELDSESGLPHMAHVQCNLLMLFTYLATYPEGDDLPTQWLSKN